MTDPVKEAVERLTDDLSRAREDGLVLTDAPTLRALLAENARLTKLVEEAGGGGRLDEGECAEALERAWRDCVTGPKPHSAVFNMVGRHFVHHYADVKRETSATRASLTHKAIKGGGE